MEDKREKMPRLIKAFLLCYIGSYPIMAYYQTNSTEYLFTKIVILTIGSFFFSYGVICFIQDVRSGGINLVIRKIKEFLND